MDMSMDVTNATREELLAAVLEDIGHRALLSDEQIAQWEKADTAHLEAIVVIGQAQDGLIGEAAAKALSTLVLNGTIAWVGSPTMGGWHKM